MEGSRTTSGRSRLRSPFLWLAAGLLIVAARADGPLAAKLTMPRRR
jgi:hypothetical protein